MPAGLQLFDELGREILSYTDRVTRLVGSIAIGDNGSVNLGDLKGGSIWYAFLPNSVPNQSSQAGFDVGYQPAFTVNGSVLSWAYAQASSSVTKVSGTLLYGIY